MESSIAVFLSRQPACERQPPCHCLALGGKTAGLDSRYGAVGSAHNTSWPKRLAVRFVFPPIKKPYLTGRAPGFAKDEDHFDTLTNTLGAAGLIKDTTRGGSSGSFSFLRPLASDDLTHVIAQFTAWLEMTDPAKQKFAKKMETAETNGDFNRAEFDIVMASLKGDARVQIDNR